MKKILLLFFSLLLSFNSYGEWTEISVVRNEFSEQLFLDFNNLKKKSDGYVYFWLMNSRSDSSDKIYLKTDCEGERFYPLAAVSHTEPMGGGEPTPVNSDEDVGLDKANTIGCLLNSTISSNTFFENAFPWPEMPIRAVGLID